MPYRTKPCTWNGITYPSRRAAAEANFISEAGMTYRLQQGYTCDDDIWAKDRDFGIACTWNGKPYPSISHAARANRISPTAMIYRLKRGYTCDGDLQRPVKKF